MDTDWNAGGSLKKLLECYQGWDEDMLALLAMADPPSLKIWKLLDMEVLPTWVNNKLALLGDAAHPFLPREYSYILVLCVVLATIGFNHESSNTTLITCTFD